MITVITKANIVNQPELKKGSQKSYTYFNIAVKRPLCNETDFYSVTAFGTTAEFICRNFSKGMPILIQGHLSQDRYNDKNTYLV